MDLQVRDEDGVCVIRIGGRMTMGEADAKLRSGFKDALDGGATQFVLDLEGVTFMDSASLGEVVACYKRARERQGDVKLVLSPRASNVFSIAKLHLVFETFDSVEAAVASYPV